MATVTIRVALPPADGAADGAGDAPQTATPGFRFRWITGEPVDCGTVGGAGWTDVTPATDATPPSPGGDGDDTGSTAPSVAPVCRQFEWVKEWPGFTCDDAQARQLNDRPHMCVFVSSTAKEGVNHYAGHVAVDVSPLLDGDDSVSVVAGAPPSGTTAPAPPGVQLPGVTYAAVTVAVSTPLLSPELRHALNPLAVVVRQAVNLPGIVLAEGSDPSLQRHVTPTPYSLLEAHCSPVFATFRLFDGEGAPRAVRSVGVPQGLRASWSHKSVFLLGTFSNKEVQEHIITRPVEVEVHDRDMVGWAGRPAFPAHMATEWQQMIGKPPPSATDGDGDGSPMDLAAVDEHVIGCVEAALVSAGDRNPHAVGVLHLSELMNRSVERMALLRQSLSHQQRVQQRKAASTRAAAAERKRRQREARAQALARLGITAGDGDADGDGDGADGKDGDGEADEGAPPTDTASVASDFTPVWRPGEDHDAVSFAYSVDLVPRKRRVVPKDLSNEVDYTDAQRMVCCPGQYMLSGSRLKAVATLARPVYDNAPTEPLPQLPFTRAVFVMRYDEDAMLKTALAVMEEVNMAATPEASSSRSYELTPDEVAAANDGTLDILTGFQAIDARWRVLVLEGLVSGAMARLTAAVARTFPNSLTVKYLANPEVQFNHRAYTCFHIAPKDIRLREPLTVLMKQPGLYDRSKVSQLSFDALFRLTEMRRASRLAHLKALALFPTSESLLEVENKYGDTVTLQDMYGNTKAAASAAVARFTGSPVQSPSRLKTAASRVLTGGLSAAAAAAAPADAGAGAGASADSAAANVMTVTHGSKSSRHAPMETSNPAFLDTLRARRSAETKDFIAANRDAVAGGAGAGVGANGGSLLRTTSSVDMEGVPLPGDGVPFVYSGQKLQYTELQKERMRQRLAKDKRSTYTYSADFQSLTVSMVNEAEIEQQAAAEARSRWTTKRGFVYPAPKDPAEFRRHPKAPSEARKADLRTPWDDPHDAPPAHLMDARPAKKFDSVPVRDTIFGYVDAKGNKKHDFFKSVHLCGDGLAAEEAAAKAKAAQDWMDKVVVDSLQFKRHFPPKKLTQLNKVEGMLHGPVKSKALRIVHKAKLPSGKRTAPPTAPPINAVTSGAYEPPSDFTSKLKSDNPEHFTGTDASGRNVGFVTTINPHRLKPKSHTIRYTRKIPELKPEERRGDIWGVPPSPVT